MTKAQEETIEEIRQEIPRFDFYNETSYEIKEWEVKETEWGTVVLTFETGRKNDEGTLASVLCRKSRQLFIGKRGGVACYIYNEKTKRIQRIQGLYNCMIKGKS
ncbi:MAG: hypothetical protein Q4C63_08135 [Eubacteriales bacterium]|nr:hypothetical protein [Eubacteriales bacterium]